MRILSINLHNLIFSLVLFLIAYLVDKYLANGAFGTVFYLVLGFGLGIFTPVISTTYYPITSLDKNYLKDNSGKKDDDSNKKD